MDKNVPQFHWADYLVFFLSLGLSLVVGLVFCISGMRQKATNDDYLMGGRSLNPVFVGLSMAASLLNAVFLIGENILSMGKVQKEIIPRINGPAFVKHG